MNIFTEKLRVLILTDSLSLPRSLINGKVNYNQTYVNLLRNANPNIEFIHVGIGGATITQLYNQVKYYINSDPDAVILHCGIVDCAPRALSEFENAFFSKLRIISFLRPITKTLRKYRNLCYTKPKVFKEVLQNFKKAFDNIPLISIGILPASQEYNIILPGVSRNINRFNEILEQNTIFISNKDFPLTGITEDFHHLNIEGQQLIFQKIHTLLKNKFKST